MSEFEPAAPIAPQPQALRGPSLKALALKGGLWTGAGFGTEKILQLASNLILTRLLFPEAFGIMALVNVVMIGLHLFSDIGIQPSIVQNRRGAEQTFLNTAWTIQIIRGFFLWGVAVAIAWPASLLYDQPILFPLISMVGATAAINGFQTTALATATRRIDLGRVTVMRLGVQIVAITITVALAWWLKSIWALAIGNVIGAALGTAIGHLVLPSHGHAVAIDRSALKELVRFGKWIFLTTLTTFLGGRGLRGIQGILVSAGTLGQIYIAGTLAWALGELTSRLIGTVAFPTLSKVAREDPHRFATVLTRFRTRILIPALPAFVVLALAAQHLIDFLYDDRYAPAGTYLAISALTSAVGILPMPYVNAFLAKGDSRTCFLTGVALAGLRVGGLLIGFLAGGVVGMLVGMGVATLIYYFLVAVLARRAGFLSLRIDVASIGFLFAGAVLTYFYTFAGK